MEQWSQLLQTFGLAVFILFFVGFCIISFFRWAAPRTDKLLDKVVTFIEKATDYSGRLDRLEERVTTMWEYQLRCAHSEAVERGVGTMNSPIVINEQSKSWFGELAPALREFYQKEGKNLSFNDLSLEMERRFGAEMFKKVCIPYGISQGSCLLIAIEVAKETAP